MKKWQKTSFLKINNDNYESFKITPQKGVYGSMSGDDASLCSAAPDMLAVLEQILLMVPEIPEHIRHQAQQARDKATGKEPEV